MSFRTWLRYQLGPDPELVARGNALIRRCVELTTERDQARARLRSTKTTTPPPISERTQ